MYILDKVQRLPSPLTNVVKGTFHYLEFFSVLV